VLWFPGRSLQRDCRSGRQVPLLSGFVDVDEVEFGFGCVCRGR